MAPEDWISRWQRIARRIRVPLGFLTAALYLFELFRHAPRPAAVAWSLALVVPGLGLRAYASGTVKKNRELTVTGPYAHTRNPLYLGSILIAAGFAVALLSWTVAIALALMFAAIYVPVIASEERFLRATFPGFDGYCRRVPRLIPRLTPANHPGDEELSPGTPASHLSDEELPLHPIDQRSLVGDTELPGTSANHSSSRKASDSFSLSLYLRHREYNAGIGAILLYLSLLLLRALLAAFVNLPQ
jgi:protein-S-isoprenylcysteine O-methyltransferase Ste14